MVVIVESFPIKSMTDCTKNEKWQTYLVFPSNKKKWAKEIWNYSDSQWTVTSSDIRKVWQFSDETFSCLKMFDLCLTILDYVLSTVLSLAYLRRLARVALASLPQQVDLTVLCTHMQIGTYSMNQKSAWQYCSL